MELTEIKLELNTAIENIDEILKDENFSAYQRVKSSLTKAKKAISDKEILNIQKEISFCFRLISEAPPKNKELGLEIYKKLDSIYKKTSILVNQQD